MKNKFLLFIAAAAWTAQLLPAQAPGTITVVAGLTGGSAITVDSAGNLYTWAAATYQIRKMNPAGVVSIFAGNGKQGFFGDDGPATNAQFGIDVSGRLAADPAGNVYIADTFNNRVRKVDTSGKITTVAGNGGAATPGIPNGDGGLATKAPVCQPTGLAVDRAGNIYIGSGGCLTVRKVDTAGIISTVAGKNGPAPLGDGGPATDAAVNETLGLAVDDLGNLYVIEAPGTRVRKVTTDGIINTIAGNGTNGFSGDGGPATNAQIFEARAVAVDKAGNLFICDYANGRIRRVDTSGKISTVAGGGRLGPNNGGPATNVTLGCIDMALDGSGNLYIVDGSAFVYKVWGVASATPAVPPTASVARTVSAAGQQGGAFAAESIVVATGSHLATGSATADLVNPPLILAGTKVEVTDSAGVTRPAALIRVSATEITYQIPAGTAPGAATVTVTAGDGVKGSVQIQIAAVAPGLYAQNAGGLAKAYALRISGGIPFVEEVSEIDPNGAIVARPITVSNGDQVTLIFYGTGFRAAAGDISATIGGITAPVLFAGPQGVIPGLDQFDILIPPELGTGSPQSVAIQFTAGGQSANTVFVTIQ